MTAGSLLHNTHNFIAASTPPPPRRNTRLIMALMEHARDGLELLISPTCAAALTTEGDHFNSVCLKVLLSKLLGLAVVLGAAIGVCGGRGRRRGVLEHHMFDVDVLAAARCRCCGAGLGCAETACVVLLGCSCGRVTLPIAAPASSTHRA